MDRPGALSPPAVLAAALEAFAAAHQPAAPSWCVALSGGPDSLALTAVAARRLPTTALIVDHGLQPGSADVAAAARAAALALGCADARVLAVAVGTGGGPEAAARAARYAALDGARGDAPVLLAHTRDDQAETVLLGLGRGSGGRSIAGMRAWDSPWGRPLLGVGRAVTVAACAELGLEPWLDPHNADPRFTRVRLRTEVLPLLEEVLGGGVAAALARTAADLRADVDALDALADALTADLLGDAPAGADLPLAPLAGVPDAVRRRVVRRWLLAGGARDLSSGQIHGVDALITGPRGRGGVAVGAGLAGHRLFAERRGSGADAVLALRSEPV